MQEQDLINFEKEIEDQYKQGKIRAPVHLNGGNEKELISLFKGINENDWVFATYRNHYQALLKGIPKDWLKQEILDWHSMHIMNAEHKFYSSSIVGGHLPIALGTAMALKRKKSTDKVWVFCGDMASETGIFHECTKYADGHNLPINFIIEDNGLSVSTPTREVWGTENINENFGKRGLESKLNLLNEQDNTLIRRHSYNRLWPHHGIGMWVEFPEEEKIKRPNYFGELKKAMGYLGKDSRTVFIGQTVNYPGSPMYESLESVDANKKIELPVMEEVQMGITTGLALEGYIPISIYPRWDFLISATNQLVNHLDKTSELSKGRFNPVAIIRTSTGCRNPLNPGPQHYQNHTEAYRKMLTNVDVVELKKSEDVRESYEQALQNQRPTLIVEHTNLYHAFE